MAQAYSNFVLARRDQIYRRKIQRRHIRDASNPFEIPDREFIELFRINKVMAQYLCTILSEAMAPRTSYSLPVHIKILTSVRILSNGSYQKPTGQDHIICIGQTTVSKYLAQFVDAVINVLLPSWIYFPTSEEGRRSIALQFLEKYGIPNVIGAIDCTHVAIFPPPAPQGVQYKNRKGFHSINTQLVVDVNGKILNINARYPGRVHDQFVFNNCNLRNELIHLYNNRIGNYFLLGDSGYALEPWLMTPILNAPVDSPEYRFTQWHCRVRNCIERTNGYMKGIFRCLGHDRVLHYSPEKASKIIYTCATLYNIMLYYRIPMSHVDTDTEIAEMVIPLETPSLSITQAAHHKRDYIVQEYFS